jgi:hypothetical protein
MRKILLIFGCTHRFASPGSARCVPTATPLQRAHRVAHAIFFVLIHNQKPTERLNQDMASYEYSVLAELAAPAPAGLSDSAPLTFSYIFRTHAAYVLGLMRRLGVSAHDAEDVAQEVFLAVHAALPHFERRSKLKTWLCAICLHKVQDYRRQEYRRRETVSADPPLLADTDTPQEGLRR